MSLASALNGYRLRVLRLFRALVFAVPSSREYSLGMAVKSREQVRDSRSRVCRRRGSATMWQSLTPQSSPDGVLRDVEGSASIRVGGKGVRGKCVAMVLGWVGCGSATRLRVIAESQKLLRS